MSRWTSKFTLLLAAIGMVTVNTQMSGNGGPVTTVSAARTFKVSTSKTAANAAIEHAVANPAIARVNTSKPVTNDGPPPDLSGVHFITQSVGYGVTGEMTNGVASAVRTTDGGKRWTTVGTWAGDFGHLSWFGKTGVATLLTASSSDVGVQVRIVMTIDNGATWHVVTPHIEGMSQAGAGTAEPYAYVTADGAIWLLVSPEAATIGASSPVWVSRDAGATFTEVTLPKGLVSTGGFSASPSGHLVALTTMNSTTHRFEVVSGNEKLGWRQIGPDLRTPIYAVDYTSPTTVYVGGGNFAKFGQTPAEEIWRFNPDRPNDSRVVWRRDAPHGDPYKPIVALQWSDNGTGYALTGGTTMGGNLPAPGALFVTHDGGQHVVQESVGGTEIDVLGRAVWVVGNGEGIERSWDSGRTWQVLFRPDTVIVQSVQFVTADTGFATTQFGVYTTSDGGRSWQKDTALGLISDGETLDFVSPSTVYRWNVERLEVSTDGGAVWRMVHLPPLEQIDSVSALRGGVIQVSGLPVPSKSGPVPFYVDEFLTTVDGGQHWSVVSHAFGTSPVNLAFVNQQIGYGKAPSLNLKVASGPAKLFATQDGGRSWTAIDLSSSTDTGGNTLTAFPQGVTFSAEMSTPGGGLGGLLIRSSTGISDVTAYRLGDWLPDSLSFTSPSNGWMASGGRLFHTREGGKTWDQVWVVE